MSEGISCPGKQQESTPSADCLHPLGPFILRGLHAQALPLPPSIVRPAKSKSKLQTVEEQRVQLNRLFGTNWRKAPTGFGVRS